LSTSTWASTPNQVFGFWVLNSEFVVLGFLGFGVHLPKHLHRPAHRVSQGHDVGVLKHKRLSFPPSASSTNRCRRNRPWRPSVHHEIPPRPPTRKFHVYAVALVFGPPCR
jgi:hypothetical protein